MIEELKRFRKEIEEKYELSVTNKSFIFPRTSNIFPVDKTNLYPRMEKRQMIPCNTNAKLIPVYNHNKQKSEYFELSNHTDNSFHYKIENQSRMKNNNSKLSNEKSPLQNYFAKKTKVTQNLKCDRNERLDKKIVNRSQNHKLNQNSEVKSVKALNSITKKVTSESKKYLLRSVNIQNVQRNNVKTTSKNRELVYIKGNTKSENFYDYMSTKTLELKNKGCNVNKSKEQLRTIRSPTEQDNITNNISKIVLNVNKKNPKLNQKLS